MALAPGTQAPDFSAPGPDGRTWTTKELAGQPYVLTFYPKDETPGCTRQVCSFRDAWSDFQEMGVPVFGVSRDDARSHESFAAGQRLPFVLLTDATGQMHKAFDVGRMFGVTRRVSYLVDGDGRIVAAYEATLRPAVHAQRMLEAARALGESAE